MDEHLTDALDEVLSAREKGVEITREWLAARYPDLCQQLWNALALAEHAATVSDPVVDVPARVGPYRVLRRLGRGGMGTVYVAEADDGAPAGLTAGARVALKVVHPHHVNDDVVERRFMREAGIGSRIRHPNVVRVLDVGVDDRGGARVVYQALEYVEGRTLRQLLESTGPVPEPLCRRIGLEAARGLRAIHEVGAVHRDIKPENMLLTTDETVKIMDLGVAAVLEAGPRPGGSGTFVGTAWYAAPEQMDAGASVDARADLYALGLVLHELAFGRHKIADADPEPDSIAVSSFLREVIAVLTSPAPSDRFASAADLERVLEESEQSSWWGLRRHRRYGLAPRTRAQTAFCGSRESLEGLREIVRGGKDGHVVLIEGEPGIGKSRLVDELLVSLHEESRLPQLLLAAHGPGQAAWSRALRGALRRFFGQENLADRLAPFFESAPFLLPAFIAHLEGADAGTAALSNQTLLTAYVLTLRGLSESGPVLVVIEDLHFATAGERNVFDSVARSVPGSPVVVLGTLRPDVPRSWVSELTCLGHVEHLHVPRLEREHVGRLAEQVLNGPSAAELTATLHQKAGGNPFFVLEALRELTRSESLERGSDAWHLNPAAHVSIPASIRDLVHRRAAGLDRSDHEILGVASCCGADFDSAVVSEAVGVPVDTVLRRLSVIAQGGGLVRVADAGFAFDHHQVQEALYDSLPDDRSRAYHRSIGRVLQRRLGLDPAEDERVVVCRHLLLGRSEDARPYVLPALLHLERTFQYQAGVMVCDEALACPDLLEGTHRAQVCLRKAMLLEPLARTEERGAALGEAAHLARAAGAAGLSASVAVAQAEHLGHVGNAVDAIGILDQAIDEAASERDLALMSALHAALGGARAKLGQNDEAISCYQRALEYAQEAGGLPAEIRACHGLGRGYAMVGALDEARKWHDRELALCKSAGDVRAEADALGALGETCVHQSTAVEAERWIRDRLRLCERMGDRLGQATAHRTLGNIMRGHGELSRAREHHQRALRLHAESGEVLGEALSLGNIAVTHAGEGQYGDSDRLLRLALAQVRRIGSLFGVSATAFRLGEGQYVMGKLDRAHAFFEEALDATRRMGSALGESRIRCAFLELEDEAGAPPEKLLAGWRELLGFQEPVGSHPDISRSHIAMAELLVRLSRAQEVRSVLEAADLHLRKAGQPGLTVHAAVIRARVEPSTIPTTVSLFEAEQGRLNHVERMRYAYELWLAGSNAQYLELAYTLLIHLRDHASEDCKESVLTEVRLHREILEAWRAHAD